MDVSDYRKQYADELEEAAKRRSSFWELSQERSAAGRRGVAAEAAGLAHVDDVAAALDVLSDRKADPELRTVAVRVIGGSVRGRPELIDRLLELLRDESEHSDVRHAALSALQTATFLAGLFAQKRPDYLDTLRSITDDHDVELRRRAIGILAREKDEYVQRRLLEGLEDRSKALVPAAKAIQFLGYDVHAEHFPLLRQIVEHPQNRAAKKEAVRLLAADPGSRDVLAELLGDKDESHDVRNISAIGLQSLAPRRFEEIARRIALDEDEDDRLRATCINALGRFANPAAYREDGELTASVERLQRKSPSPQVKRATRDYMAKLRG